MSDASPKALKPLSDLVMGLNGPKVRLSKHVTTRRNIKCTIEGNRIHFDVLTYKEAKKAFEIDYCTELLNICNGNVSLAARLAKKDRKDVYELFKRCNIDPTQFREGEEK